jgi:hypothetical protein
VRESAGNDEAKGVGAEDQSRTIERKTCGAGTVGLRVQVELKVKSQIMEL